MKLRKGKIKEIIREVLTEVYGDQENSVLMGVDQYGATYNLGNVNFLDAPEKADAYAAENPAQFVEFYVIRDAAFFDSDRELALRWDDLERMHYETGEAVKL